MKWLTLPIPVVEGLPEITFLEWIFIRFLQLSSSSSSLILLWNILRVIVFVHFSVSFYLILVLSAKKKIKNYVIIMWVGGAGREWLLLFNQEFVLISTKLWHQGNSWLDWFFSRNKNKNKTFWNLSSLIIADMGFCFSPF